MKFSKQLRILAARGQHKLAAIFLAVNGRNEKMKKGRHRPLSGLMGLVCLHEFAECGTTSWCKVKWNHKQAWLLGDNICSISASAEFINDGGIDISSKATLQLLCLITGNVLNNSI